jgi:acetyl-CoA carboxylase biotin carboxyl carrier protein
MTEVKLLAELLTEHSLTRLEYEKDGLRITLERRAGVEIPPVAAVPPSPLEAAAVSDNSDAPVRGTSVTSPLVGVVYGAPQPGAAPFITVGQRVKQGDALCVIEAMKTFSEIPAPCDGMVSEIHFEDGQLAEYGAVLVVLS